MNLVRNALVVGIVVVSFLLLREWSEFEEKQKEAAYQNETNNGLAINSSADSLDIDNPTIDNQSTTEQKNGLVIPNDEIEEQPTVSKNIQKKLIHVKTDTFNLAINPIGGDIEKVELIKHYRKLNTPEEPFTLMTNTNARTYISQSGLMGSSGIDNKGPRPHYSTAQTIYSFDESSDTLDVDFNYQENGVTYTKRFTFEKNSYLINISYIIQNNSSSPWVGKMFGIIRRDSSRPDKNSSIGTSPYLGAAITTEDKNYKEVSFKDLASDGPFSTKKEGGWVAMVQHYFISAWIPNTNDINKFELQKINNSDQYQFGFTGETKTINVGETATIAANFYAGPKDINALEKISPYLDLTIDYSFLWFIAKPLFKALSAIHNVVGNWGFAIILLTCLIKLLFLYPSAMSYRSMARMKKLTPKLTALKERHGDDRQKMSSEMMKLYKDEKVNPLGGCLPMLLQMPVFLSLYWVILESVELRHSPFILWIHDLSIKDPLFILPALMGVCMFIQFKLNPAPADPMQAKIMKMMPIVFTAFSMFFPAGLVLYWVVNTFLSILQQYFITRQIEKGTA